VLFGAAIPGQGGVSHVNEQWPSWWRAKFAARGYEAFDVFRSRAWTTPGVAWWYRQNTFLYVKQEATRPDRAALRGLEGAPVDLVHPALYDAKVAEIRRVHERPDGRFVWQTLRRWVFGGPKRRDG
jgi:hypothetical protein